MAQTPIKLNTNPDKQLRFEDMLRNDKVSFSSAQPSRSQSVGLKNPFASSSVRKLDASTSVKKIDNSLEFTRFNPKQSAGRLEGRKDSLSTFQTPRVRNTEFKKDINEAQDSSPIIVKVIDFPNDDAGIKTTALTNQEESKFQSHVPIKIEDQSLDELQSSLMLIEPTGEIEDSNIREKPPMKKQDLLPSEMQRTLVERMGLDFVKEEVSTNFISCEHESNDEGGRIKTEEAGDSFVLRSVNLDQPTQISGETMINPAASISQIDKQANQLPCTQMKIEEPVNSNPYHSICSKIDDMFAEKLATVKLEQAPVLDTKVLFGESYEEQQLQAVPKQFSTSKKRTSETYEYERTEESILNQRGNLKKVQIDSGLKEQCFSNTQEKIKVELVKPKRTAFTSVKPITIIHIDQDEVFKLFSIA